MDELLGQLGREVRSSLIAKIHAATELRAERIVADAIAAQEAGGFFPRRYVPPVLTLTIENRLEPMP